MNTDAIRAIGKTKALLWFQQKMLAFNREVIAMARYMREA
jgi:hypothetical protein